MSFGHHEARVKLPDEVWAAFPQVQIFISQDGGELRLVIVPAADRFLPPGVVRGQPEVLFLHSALIDLGTKAI